MGLAVRSPRLQASARGAAVAVAVSVVVASLELWHLLLSSDFSYRYVAEETSLTLPLLYKFAAFWSGFAGSLLLWVLILSLYLAAEVVWPRPEARPYLPFVTPVLLAVQGFFLLVLNLLANPFAKGPPGVLDGSGLNPLLQYPEMAIHPVLLYAGFTGMTVPFAYAMAALLRGGPDANWLLLTRRTTLTAWLFLTAGIVLGAHWSYRVLGWGGYWAWDPVENASFLPWLTAAAFVHAAVVEDRRGAMRGWNVVLTVVTFLLTLFGTFLTRSGIVSSIHAFTGTDVWPWFLGFLALTTVGSATLLALRWRQLGDRPVEGHLASRETSFLLNNLLLLGAAVAILWGTIYPLVTEAVVGQTFTAGPAFYDAVFGPVAVALVLLMGVGPVLPWRRAEPSAVRRRLAPSVAAFVAVGVAVLAATRAVGPSLALAADAFAFTTMAGEFGRAARTWQAAHGGGWSVALARAVARDRRLYGGYLTHVGVVLVVVGVVGSQAFQSSRTVTLAVGQGIRVGGFHVRLEGIQTAASGPYPATVADLAASGPGGSARIRPAQVELPTQATPMGRPAVWSTPVADVYAVLSGTQGRSATLLLIVNPLVAWIWVGAAVTVAGMLLALSHARRSAPDRRLAAVQGAWRG